MLKNQTPINTALIKWSKINEHLSYKHLNGDMTKNAHTIILHSQKRKPSSLMGHFHKSNEEFYCLNGNFTFDGSFWFGANSYAFYPAYFVHGTAVNIKGGYTLYLRLSGEPTAYFVNFPQKISPYPLEGAVTKDKPSQIQNSNEGLQQHYLLNDKSTWVSELHIDKNTGTGSSVLCYCQNTSNLKNKVFNIKTNETIELFVLSGSFALDEKTILSKNYYTCRTGENISLPLTCIASGKLLISHKRPINITN